MTVSIKKVNVSVLCDLSALRRDANRLLKHLDYADFALGILLTDNAGIKEYNSVYRKKDSETDILSFSFYEDLKPGSRIVPTSDDEKNLGDLVISLEYVEKHAKNWDETFKERLQTLLVHGICHLLGYDHEKDEDYVVMAQEEKRLLHVLGRK